MASRFQGEEKEKELKTSLWPNSKPSSMVLTKSNTTTGIKKIEITELLHRNSISKRIATINIVHVKTNRQTVKRKNTQHQQQQTNK